MTVAHEIVDEPVCDYCEEEFPAAALTVLVDLPGGLKRLVLCDSCMHELWKSSMARRRKQ
jgi:hypothetical protein